MIWKEINMGLSARFNLSYISVFAYVFVLVLVFVFMSIFIFIFVFVAIFISAMMIHPKVINMGRCPI